MNKCAVCGLNSVDELCFRHKHRQPLRVRKPMPRAVNTELIQIKMQQTARMRAFFVSIWMRRRHVCENCGKWLGKEPLSYMFDHLLEKSKYPELMYEELNIMFTCLECHDNKTRGKLTEIVKNRIQIVRDKFGK